MAGPNGPAIFVFSNLDTSMLQSYHAGDDSKDLFQGYIFKDFITKRILGQWSIGGKMGIPYPGRDLYLYDHQEKKPNHNMKVLFSEPQENHITLVWVSNSKVASELGIGRHFSGVNFGRTFLAS